VKQLNVGFLEIGAEKKRIPGLKNAANFGEKSNAGGAVEIPDGASQEQYEEVLAGRAVRGYFEQSIEVFALEAQNADGLDVAEFALAHGERRWRNLDGVVGRALATAKSFENVARFASAAAAKFSHGDWSGQALDDVMTVAPQQALIGARKAILRQIADHFEQSGAHIVVQILRQQLFLTRLGEAGAHVGCEFVACIRSDSLNQHVGNSSDDESSIVY
jgi:hypothetical protein